jgi:membrane carboxypeptidase/penicillin-binding protein
MLIDVVDWGTGSAARGLGVRFPVGGKTGTTDDFKDAWFVGFSSELVAAVWVGFDKPATIRRDGYGARVALPIWADFMRRTARLRPPERFEIPPGIAEKELCRVSYLRPVDGCPTYMEFFKEGDDEPGRLCPVHRGDLKHRVERAVRGLLERLGSKIEDLWEEE